MIRNSSHIPEWLKEAGGGTKLSTDEAAISELKRILPVFRKLKLYNEQLNRFMLKFYLNIVNIIHRFKNT